MRQGQPMEHRTTLVPAQTVVFDLGGVVFNWQPFQLLQQVLPQHAHDTVSAQALAQQIFQTFRLDGDWAQFDLGQVEPPALADRIARRTGLLASEIMALIDAIPPHLQPQRGTVALMEALRQQGHRLVYLSNMPALYADQLEREHSFFRWFDGGVFSARVGQMKPDPAIYRTAIDRLSLQGQTPLFIDDVQHNLDAARAVGWRGLRFESPPQLGSALRSLGLLGALPPQAAQPVPP